MARVMLHTGPGVFEVLANVCRSPQEALKQFVENAADAIEQAKTDNGHIRLKLQYMPAGNGQKEARMLSRIAIEDNGVGMTTGKMRQVLSSIGDSEKINLALRGEQGIGLLAFALIAGELHLASSAVEGLPSSCLVLKRGWLRKGHAEILEHCAAHEHYQRGTIAYLEGILPEVASQLSRERIKECLGQQFANDLRASLYSMSIAEENGEFEQIHSQRYRGVKALSTNLPLGNGSAYVELYVLPWEMADASISLYGSGGTRICLLTEIPEFKRLPWSDRRLEGYIRCDRLKRTADKTAVVQDQVLQSFIARLKELEPRIQQLIQEISADSQERRFNIIFSRLGRLIDKFLRYREKGLLADLSPQGTLVTSRADQPGRGMPKQAVASPAGAESKAKRAPADGHSINIRLGSPPQDKAEYRSWFDPSQGIICINREHAEFLLSQREDRRCLRYLFTLWVKESLLQQYGAYAEKVADEMVSLLAEAESLLW